MFEYFRLHQPPFFFLGRCFFLAAWGCCCRGGTTFAVLPPADADGVPGGEAGLGLPGVLGLADLREKEQRK